MRTVSGGRLSADIGRFFVRESSMSRACPSHFRGFNQSDTAQRAAHRLSMRRLCHNDGRACQLTTALNFKASDGTVVPVCSENEKTSNGGELMGSSSRTSPPGDAGDTLPGDLINHPPRLRWWFFVAFSPKAPRRSPSHREPTEGSPG